MTTDVETPSGKGAGDENFPVGSWLIRRDLRPHVQIFYTFARAADDIADNSGLSAEEKVRRLDLMGAILDGAPGAGSPAAAAMRRDARETGVSLQHSHDVLRAFKLDATKLRYRDWNDLMEYCRYSASPVGRQLLDLHGEAKATWPASDALCSALQVLNHLQDCGDDYRALDRVYLPAAELAASGAQVAELAGQRLTPGLRATLDALLAGVEKLLVDARRLPALVSSPGLRCECAVIVTLAERLTRLLRRGDPLAQRVKLAKADFAAALALGLWRGFRARSPG